MKTKSFRAPILMSATENTPLLAIDRAKGSVSVCGIWVRGEAENEAKKINVLLQSGTYAEMDEVNFKIDLADVHGISIILKVIKYLKAQYPHVVINWFSYQDDADGIEIGRKLGELAGVFINAMLIPNYHLKGAA